jgi:hypothetical protein
MSADPGQKVKIFRLEMERVLFRHQAWPETFLERRRFYQSELLCPPRYPESLRKIQAEAAKGLPSSRS